MKKKNETPRKYVYELAANLIDLIDESDGGIKRHAGDYQRLVKQIAHEIWNFEAKPEPNPAIPENTPTVADLRRAGLKVRVIEVRNVYSRVDRRKLQLAVGKVRQFNRGMVVAGLGKIGQLEILPHGGYQRVEITLPDGKELAGEAITLDYDIFDRKYGRNLSVSRAFAGVNLEDYKPVTAQ